MSKKITTILVITNLLTGLLLFMTYSNHQALKKEILMEYALGQVHIDMALDGVIKSYEIGSRTGYASGLRQATNEYYLAVNLLSDHKIGAQFEGTSDLLKFSWAGQYFLQRYASKSAEEELSAEDMEEIQQLSDKMNEFAEKLDLEELRRKSPSGIIKRLNEILVEVEE